MHGVDEASCERVDRLAQLTGPSDNLVVNIRYISYVTDIQTATAKDAHDHIKDHKDARMTKMAVVINRHATDIHPDLPLHERLEGLFSGSGCCKCVGS